MRQISREEARRVDRRAVAELGIPTLCLMENAGSGAARIALGMLMESGTQADGPPPVCVVGPGANGGDACVVARHLVVAGFSPRILAWNPSAEPAESDSAPSDARIAHLSCVRLGVPVVPWPSEAARSLLAGASLLVDGLFGTGLARDVTGPAADLVCAMNAARRPVLALDVPSGLDADRGVPLGVCVRADVTATFVAPKTGFAAPGADAWTGLVRVVPIGVPVRLADAEDAPPR